MILRIFGYSEQSSLLESYLSGEVEDMLRLQVDDDAQEYKAKESRAVASFLAPCYHP
jgi:hypothetical protein